VIIGSSPCATRSARVEAVQQRLQPAQALQGDSLPPWPEAGEVAWASVVLATLVGLWPAYQATRLRIPEAIAYGREVAGWRVGVGMGPIGAG